MKVRRLGLLGILGVVACWLMTVPGCNEDEPGQAKPLANPFAGQTITVACPAGAGFGDAWKAALDEWAEQTGTTCKFNEYTPGSASKGLPAGDVIVMAYADVPEFAVHGRLSRIPREIQAGAENWVDFFPGVRERLLMIGSRPSLVPISCPVLTCYLRGDLLSKAGLKPPTTWDEYQTLLETLPKWAPGLTAVEPWGPDFRATMFLARALPYVKNSGDLSVYFNIETGAPLIDSPGFARALTQAVAAVSKLSSDCKSLTPADCRRLILTGNAAMAISMDPGRAGEKPIARAPGAALSFCRIPGARQVYNRQSAAWESDRGRDVNYATLAPVGGLAIGVAKSTHEKTSEAAWNLVAFLTVDRYEQALATVAKSACRESQAAKGVDWLGPELHTDELYGYLAVTAESLRPTNPSPELPVLARVEFRKALTDGITAALEGKVQPEAALKEIAQRWNAISVEIGVDKIRDSYRAGLGISPVLKIPKMSGRR
jgi:ABC-type glycerol-3-phosphate transport system substrate-binding protein